MCVLFNLLVMQILTKFKRKGTPDEEETGMLEVMEAKLKGVKWPEKWKQYTVEQRRRLFEIQQRLNRLLQVAKLWTKEKEAKVLYLLQ